MPSALNLPHVANQATVIEDSIVGAAPSTSWSRHAVEVKAARFHRQNVSPPSSLTLLRGRREYSRRVRPAVGGVGKLCLRHEWVESGHCRNNDRGSKPACSR